MLLSRSTEGEGVLAHLCKPTLRRHLMEIRQRMTKESSERKLERGLQVHEEAGSQKEEL